MAVPAAKVPGSGAAARKQPQRSCVACRQQRDKRDLIRVVRDAAGGVSVDERGRAAGRGAYLCNDAACWTRALDGEALDRALRGRVSAEDRVTLRTFAAERVRAPAEGGSR